MIGLDTNVLIRYLTQDHPVQSKKANELIAKAIKEKKFLWIGLITICETVWVLERCYKLKKHEIVSTISAMLNTEQLRIESSEVVWVALQNYETSSKIGFSDCLIAHNNATNHCLFTYTFDSAAAKASHHFKKI